MDKYFYGTKVRDFWLAMHSKLSQYAEICLQMKKIQKVSRLLCTHRSAQIILTVTTKLYQD